MKSRSASRKAEIQRSPFREIDLDLIRPNPEQPRREFDGEALASLAQSLTNQGVLQPILVSETEDGRYELVSGERRWRAAQLAGLLRIPALVRPIDPKRRLEFALVENLQRENLNPVEVAESYQRLLDETGLTQQEVAERIGKPRTTVTNSLRLLSLPKAVRSKLIDGTVSTGHAKALLGLDRPGRQAELADQVVRQRLSVRQLEALVLKEKNRSDVKIVRKPAQDPNVAHAEQELQKALGTKVRIVPSKKGGRIELHCFSSEELDKMYELVMKAARQ